MTLQCAQACLTCHLIEMHERCPLDATARRAFGPGDVNTMFSRIARGDWDQFSPRVLVRPDDGPWLVALDNFLDGEEADALVAAGTEAGFRRDRTWLEKLDGGASFEGLAEPMRTSEHASCTGDCASDHVVQRVWDRMLAVAGVGGELAEPLQIVKYGPGQMHGRHHDYLPMQKDRIGGPRVLTFLLYLSDVEEGGGTGFPSLDYLTVRPRKGRVLLWSSVLDWQPNVKDPLMDHESLPVVRGYKFEAYAWLHLYDYQDAIKKGCVTT
mmetsp:Transcript_16430/g.32637  ORF Transcript_16430/g.32637 Transcript_16430/m.32637 type:complete len:268 (-) Transcript_16430:120-923(-)